MAKYDMLKSFMSWFRNKNQPKAEILDIEKVRSLSDEFYPLVRELMNSSDARMKQSLLIFGKMVGEILNDLKTIAQGQESQSWNKIGEGIESDKLGRVVTEIGTLANKYGLKAKVDKMWNLFKQI